MPSVDEYQKKRRRILFLVPTLSGGGSERVIVTLLRFLDRSHFEPTLAVVDMRNEAYRADIPQDVTTIDMGGRRVRYAWPRIIWMIWRQRPDVVFTTLGQLNLAIGLLRPVLPGNIRYVARETVVVTELLKGMSLGWIWAVGYRLFYRKFDKIVCQSRDMQEDLIENYGLAPHRLVLIPNPVDIKRIRSLAVMPVESGLPQLTKGFPVLRLVAAGRLVYQKGFDLLIDAIALLRGQRLHLTILGDGPLRSELMQKANRLGVGNQVRFVGFQPNPYPYFRQADIFVLSSRFEGLPNVVLEALACGTPVVATPAPGGVREILEGMEGCRVSARVDGKSLAESLSGLIPTRKLAPDILNTYEATTVTKRYEAAFMADLNN